MKEMSVKEMREVNGGFWIAGIAFGAWLLRCNRYTDWGTNGKPCICGFH